MCLGFILPEPSASGFDDNILTKVPDIFQVPPFSILQLQVTKTSQVA